MQPFKSGEGFSVSTCKTKSTRNPLYRWVIGAGAINEFAFSPCAKYLAVAGQDGHLRVFNYNSMELVGTMKSYFGGLLCVCWSPDGKFLVAGGEDDLVSVWSFHEKRVICRGHGHRSWVNVVAFDIFTCLACDDTNCEFVSRDSVDSSSSALLNSVGQPANHVAPGDGSSGGGGKGPGRGGESCADSTQHNGSHANSNHNSTTPAAEQANATCVHYTTYRFGSVGQDTDLCLWELTEDIVRQPYNKQRASTCLGAHASGGPLPRSNSLPNDAAAKTNVLHNNTGGSHTHHPDGPDPTHHTSNSVINTTTKFATLSVADRKESQDKKEHKRNFSLSSRNNERVGLLSKANHVKPCGHDAVKLYGTPACPRLDEVPVLEPLVCKKVAHERLTSVVFRQECLVTACQEGLVYTWARPGSVVSHASFSLSQSLSI